MSLAQLKKIELIERQGTLSKKIQMVGKSCFLFTKENWLRKICYHIVKYKLYDTFVLVLIAVSTILLTLDNPNMDDKGMMAEVL